jgi:Acyclic terpene utilisation family protein AtuA
VSVDGATGRARPETLKVSLACRDDFIGEGQISYAGAGAVDRARLAADIVVDRLKRGAIAPKEIRCDLIGLNSLHASRLGADSSPYEVRLRVAARTSSLAAAHAVANEVESLYTNGPAGGGGATKSAREVLALLSTYIPRELVRCEVRLEVA